MATLTISDDKELVKKLEAIAENKGVSVEELVQQLLKAFVARQRTRHSDPIRGIFDSGEPDIVSRHEDILRDEWKPD